MRTHKQIHTYISKNVCIYVCMHAYTRTYVRMYVCMYVCIYVSIRMYVHTYVYQGFQGPFTKSMYIATLKTAFASSFVLLQVTSKSTCCAATLKLHYLEHQIMNTVHKHQPPSWGIHARVRIPSQSSSCTVTIFTLAFVFTQG